ncbi:tripartite tricarboxylate transporter TctB family protein [Ruegeria arenilitoris]|uniref:tripartite tricarboxylate transporter TctB family protein n=1 Tax=Ruegeria arenilitoris TaxID=1173585 RepID=UPI00147E7CFE|nr:tripartite tricarboxylate transporter TctB family protein [Ruegeria arenilitoris]
MSTEIDIEVVRKTARHNIFAGLALGALAAFFFWKSFAISLDFVDEEGIGPRFFPQSICLALGLIGATMVVFGLREQIAPADKSTFDAKRFFADAVPLFLLGLAFVWMFGAFGYVTACFVLLLVAAVLFAVRGPALILLPVCATAALYLLFFKVMTVFEPAATIFNPLSLFGLK